MFPSFLFVLKKRRPDCSLGLDNSFLLQGIEMGLPSTLTAVNYVMSTDVYEIAHTHKNTYNGDS